MARRIDLIANLFGVAFYFTWMLLWSYHEEGRWHVVGALVATLMFVAIYYPAMRVARAFRDRARLER